MIGLVIKTTGNGCTVRLDLGEERECYIKGNFRIKGIRTTNPVAVGDYVEIEEMPDGTNWIVAVQPRKNYIIRKSTNLSKEAHVLAANIDQVALLVTINHPSTSTTFIDRFLATCEAYAVPAVLIFNKIDILSKEEIIVLENLMELYKKLQYEVYAIQANDTNEEHVKELKRRIFDGKVTLLSGNSGVGKSTLLNTLFGKKMTRTGEVSSSNNKGVHTTTFSEMYPITNGYVIDTPGIKGFGSVDMKEDEVDHYFREIFTLSHDCKYDDCKHIEEPGCAVREAVENQVIAKSRFDSYLSILGDCKESKYR